MPYNLFFAFLLIFAACQTSQKSATSSEHVKPDAPLGQAAADSAGALPVKSSWQLESINGQLFSEARLTGHTPTLIMDLEAGKANGNAGCNQYNMALKTDGAKLIFGHIMITKMACQEMGLESSFLNALMERPVKYEYKPTQLLITDNVRNVLILTPLKQ